jgi:hypothetical protein
MHLYPKRSTNISILAAYLLAWVLMGVGANVFVAYGVVDISISTLIAGGLLGLLFAIALDLLGIVDYLVSDSPSDFSGLIENAFRRPPSNTPQTEYLVNAEAQTDLPLQRSFGARLEALKQENSMKYLSNSKHLAALGLALAFIVVVDWCELATAGFAHNLFEALRHTAMFVLSVGFALYATEPPGSGKDKLAKPTVISLLALPSRTLDALAGRTWGLVYKGLFAFGLSLLALVSIADDYSRGNWVTWINSFLICSAALGFCLSVVLHLVTDSHVADSTKSSSRSITREPIVNSLADNPRGESLALLIISQVLLSFAVACFVAALKHAHPWFCFVAESAACLCFTVLFVRSQLNFLRTKESE